MAKVVTKLTATKLPAAVIGGAVGIGSGTGIGNYIHYVSDAFLFRHL